ncbi:MAG: response regulator [Myxococcota bacterium]|nr:response regulator [Myxococcota bacterium]
MSPNPAVILVIDDDEQMLRLVELAFRGTRARVVRQHGGFGALTAIATHRPALVLLDVTMPGLDGPSLVELVRADGELKMRQILPQLPRA